MGGRKIKEQFRDMTTDLKLSLVEHQSAVGKVFDNKITQQSKVLGDTENSLIVKINSTLVDNTERMAQHLNANADITNKLLKETESNVNHTLSQTVDEIQKYLMPTVSQFTDTLSSEMSNVKNFIENEFTESLESTSDLKSVLDDIRGDSNKVVKDLATQQQDTLSKYKALENSLELNVVKLNKSMHQDFYSHRTLMLEELAGLRKNIVTQTNSNHEQVKTMFDNSVVKNINDALDSMKMTFDDIESKLANIEDEKEDLMPNISDAMQNIMKDGVDDLKNSMDYSVTTPLKGQLETIQTLLTKMGSSKAKYGSNHFSVESKLTALKAKLD